MESAPVGGYSIARGSIVVHKQTAGDSFAVGW